MEKLFHLLAWAGFIVLGILKLLMPELLDLNTTLAVFALLLWCKAIGDLVVDSHNVINYHR